jgi:hypothetical protein
MVSAHFKYLQYVLRHKWFVFQAGRLLHVNWFQLLIHDWSKFTIGEWFPYVYFFYRRPNQPMGAGKTGYMHKPGQDIAFDVAWNHHQKVNKHHWQFWVLIRDNDDPKFLALPMPTKYVREMVADWMGAGMAQNNPDVGAWYQNNREKLILHPQTRGSVEGYLDALGFQFGGFTPAEVE